MKRAMVRAYAHADFYVTRWLMVVSYTLTNRHDHDGPTVEYCSCGCPNARCYPCGDDRKPEGLR